MSGAIAQELKRSAGKASGMLAALGNDNRLMILCHLLQGERRVSDLVELVGLSQPALSQQLSKLRGLGLIGQRREGRSIYYRIVSDEALRIIETLYEIYCPPKAPKPAEPK